MLLALFPQQNSSGIGEGLEEGDVLSKSVGEGDHEGSSEGVGNGLEGEGLALADDPAGEGDEGGEGEELGSEFSARTMGTTAPVAADPVSSNTPTRNTAESVALDAMASSPHCHGMDVRQYAHAP